MEVTNLFIDPEGEPLRFFLPMSLVSRSVFKDKIEHNGGVLVQSELMNNIIKIGDPAKPQSYDASWLNFRYIDDALREGELQNPEFYVMDNPGMVEQMMMPTTTTTQRATPASGGLPNGIGSRGTRMEFTPEEDDILRRIVHRPGVATSGNKIYQLIAQQYGGHSFHSWRDRYIRHMRPIWGPPTDEDAMDVNRTDDYILNQSFLRAPHIAAERSQQRERTLSENPEGTPGAEEDLRTPATPPVIKKQRAAFSTTDDEILLRAIADNGETAATFKLLGQRHPHHTWESWKNRVKALKKKGGGVLPDYSQGLTLADLSDLSHSNLDLDLSMEDHASNLKALHQHQQQQQQGEQEQEQQEHGETEAGQGGELVDPNIDPNLQLQQQLSMIMDDPNQQAFERQFHDDLDISQQLGLQEQLQQEDTAASPFSYQTTEDMLRHNLQGHDGQGLDLGQHLDLRPMPQRRGKRQINIHDPTLDENAGPVSDIEDGSQPQTRGKRTSKRTAAKKRKTNAAAQAAAQRAAAVPRLSQQATAATTAAPTTPSRQIDQAPPAHAKSAKQEHHERDRPGLVPAVREHASQEFLIEANEPKTRAARARAASQEPQAMNDAIGQGKGKKWEAIQNGAKPTETFIRTDQPTLDGNVVDDDLRAEEQIRRSAAKRSPRKNKKTPVQSMPLIDEDGFLQTNDLMPAQFSQSTPRFSRTPRAQREVRATPNSSPIRPPVSQLRADRSPTYATAFDAPSPTPTSPNRSFSQSQFLQDTQAIRGDMDIDFDATIEELGFDSQDEEIQELRAVLEERKHHWIERQVSLHNIPHADAEDAWQRTCGVQSLAAKVVQAYEQGESPPRLPGIWTAEDDEILRSADAHALQAIDAFHQGGVDSRLLFLNGMQ